MAFRVIINLDGIGIGDITGDKAIFSEADMMLD